MLNLATMPRLDCPVVGCAWQSQDLDAEFAAALSTALEIHGKAVHTTQTQPTPPRLKLDPPSVAAGCDPDQWSAFTRQWDMYKIGMSIAGQVVPTALFYCRDQDLRTAIMRDIRGNVANIAEALDSYKESGCEG
jgi:hypothetical protein